MERLRKDARLRRVILEGVCLSIIAAILLSAGSCLAEEIVFINDVNDLLAVGLDPSSWDKHIILASDILFDGYEFGESVIGVYFDVGHPDNIPFTGVFDGNGHKISGLKINADSDGIGLFGLIGESGCVKNLHLENADIFTSESFTGGIAGVCDRGLISDCTVSGTVKSIDDGSAGIAGKNMGGVIKNCRSDCILSGDYYVAGIVGKNLGGTVINCNTTGSYLGNDDVGGIIGYSYSGYISHCSSSSDCTGDYYVGGLIGISYSSRIISCTASGTARGTDYVGGLIGDVTFTTSRTEKCFAMGDAYGRDFAGGLIGRNDGVVIESGAKGSVFAGNNAGGFIGAHYASPVDDCYATGNTEANNNAAGFIGIIRKGTITNCYSTGKVTAISNAGGFIGNNQDGTVVSCFWDTCSSGMYSSAGGEGLCTMQMQDPDIYIIHGWDLDSVWRFCSQNLQYPHLVSLLKMSGDITCPYGTEINDLTDLAGQWLSTEVNNPADINNDDKVDMSDFMIMAQGWE